MPNDTTISQAGAGGANCSGGSWPCTNGQSLTWSQTLNPGVATTVQYSAVVSSNPAPADGAPLSTTVSASNYASVSPTANAVVRTAGGLNTSISCPASAMSSPGVISCLFDYSKRIGISNDRIGSKLPSSTCA